MYINKTTAAERALIENVMDSSIYHVELAQRLLCDVQEDYFEDLKQKDITGNEAERVRDMLEAIGHELWQAEEKYRQAMGGNNEYEQAMLIRDVERLRAKLHWSDTKPFANLPDEEALPILQRIAKEKGIAIEE